MWSRARAHGLDGVCLFPGQGGCLVVGTGEARQGGHKERATGRDVEEGVATAMVELQRHLGTVGMRASREFPHAR